MENENLEVKIKIDKRKRALKRDRMFGVNFNKLEVNYIETVAKLKGITVSEYILSLIHISEPTRPY